MAAAAMSRAAKIKAMSQLGGCLDAVSSEAAAREWSVNGWLEESERNGTISYLRLPSSSAKASAADRELEDLRPALLRVFLPSCTLELKSFYTFKGIMSIGDSAFIPYGV